jgi:hypothetical protein
VRARHWAVATCAATQSETISKSPYTRLRTRRLVCVPRRVGDREKLPKFLERLRSEVLLQENLQSSTNVVLGFVVEVGGGGNELSFLLDVIQYRRFGTSLLQDAPADKPFPSQIVLLKCGGALQMFVKAP